MIADLVEADRFPAAPAPDEERLGGEPPPELFDLADECVSIGVQI